MVKKTYLLFIVLLLSSIFISGCTSNSENDNGTENVVIETDDNQTEDSVENTSDVEEVVEEDFITEDSDVELGELI